MRTMAERPDRTPMLDAKLSQPSSNQTAARSAVLSDPLHIECNRNIPGQFPADIKAGELIAGLLIRIDIDTAIVFAE